MLLEQVVQTSQRGEQIREWSGATSAKEMMKHDVAIVEKLGEEMEQQEPNDNAMGESLSTHL